MSAKLMEISEAENVDLSSSSANAIIKASGGDMRNAIMILQSAAQLFAGEEVPVSCIDDISGVI